MGVIPRSQDCMGKRIQKVMVESDCATAVRYVNNNDKVASPIGNIVEKCREFKKKI